MFEEKKRCSKCGKEVSVGCYIERKRLFRSKTKKWCFSCYNKLKFSVGKVELKEVVIIGGGNDSTLEETHRVPVPEDDGIISFTKLSDITDNEEESEIKNV